MDGTTSTTENADLPTPEDLRRWTELIQRAPRMLTIIRGRHETIDAFVATLPLRSDGTGIHFGVPLVADPTVPSGVLRLIDQHGAVMKEVACPNE